MGQMRKKMMLLSPMLHQGGFERVCVETARLLQPYYDVYVVIFDSKDIAYDIAGIRVTDLQLGSKKGIFAKMLQVVRRSRRVARLKEELGITIAYSFGMTANLVNVMARKRGQVWVGLRSYMDMGNPKKIRMFCKYADRVLCCSKTIENEIREKYLCDSAVTLYNPLDIEKIREDAEKETARLPWTEGRILVSMGREDEVKGFWHLVKIFALVHQKMPDTKLMIIGEGEFLEYRKLAQGLGVGSEVFFTGLQKNPYPYLRESTLYLLTSHYEGFPNAMVEAMSLGIPVIATDCMTGPREILEDKYGILMPNMESGPNMDPLDISEEEKAFAARVTALLQSGTEMESYRKLAAERASMYSKEEYVQKMRQWAEE